MKYRPSKRVVWLILPVLPLVIIGAGIWIAGRADSEAIAHRGAEPPSENKFSLVNPGSWNTSAGWFGDGMDALMEWEFNPWKEQWKRDRFLGAHLQQLANSNRPEDKAEVERLQKLGREWYERILARFPELAALPCKDIPWEENGFLQWQKLTERIRESGGRFFESDLPQDLKDSLRKNTEPDIAGMKAWLDKNRALLDEIRAIGLLPGQSAAGLSDDQRIQGRDIWARNAADALMMDARVAMADGDTARAIESIRAITGLADHLSDNGASTIIGALMSSAMRSSAQRYVLESLLPSASPGTVDLAAWQAALNPNLRSPSEAAESLRTEWNLSMPTSLLPTLSDNADPGNPRDPDALAETYTRHIHALIRQGDGLSLAEYAASPKVKTSVDHLSRRSRNLDLLGAWDPRDMFLRTQESTGLTLAAFAIMNGQSPPVDPVYGRPYKWDPVKRELAVPDLPNGRPYKTKPVIVPKM